MFAALPGSCWGKWKSTSLPNFPCMISELHRTHSQKVPPIGNKIHHCGQPEESHSNISCVYTETCEHDATVWCESGTVSQPIRVSAGMCPDMCAPQLNPCFMTAASEVMHVDRAMPRKPPYTQGAIARTPRRRGVVRARSTPLAALILTWFYKLWVLQSQSTSLHNSGLFYGSVKRSVLKGANNTDPGYLFLFFLIILLFGANRNNLYFLKKTSMFRDYMLKFPCSVKKALGKILKKTGEQTWALLLGLQPQLGMTEQVRKACCSIVVLTGANAPCSAPRSSLALNYTTTLHTHTETGAREFQDRNRYTETWTKQEKAWNKVSD